jgi:hypothetical protein
MSDEKDDVGYGRPPKSGQFSKGKSGNPKGRPKGSKNLASIVQSESRQPVRVQGPGGPRTATLLEAAVIQLHVKAAQGHLPSQREAFALARFSEEQAEAGVTTQALPEADQKMMQSILRRMEHVRNQQEPTTTDENDPK